MRFARTLGAVVSALVLGQEAAAATIWDEGVNGDLSNDRLNPTVLVLGLGSNTIIGSVTAGERDYFRINVAGGESFTQLFLAAYSPTNLSFLAIQSGTQVTVDPAAPVAGPLLGWMHPDTPFVGSDVLDDIGSGAGAIGFVPPLGPGDYSFWMQQTNPIVTSYTFDLILVPEPGTLLLVGLGLLALAARSRHRHS